MGILKSWGNKRGVDPIYVILYMWYRKRYKRYSTTKVGPLTILKNMEVKITPVTNLFAAIYSGSMSLHF